MKKNERFVAYGGCYGLLLLAAFLLQLKWQGYICCSIVFVLVMWRMDKVLKEEGRQKIRLQEAELYMEQMLYAFLQNPKILSALETVCVLFEPGAMRKQIETAIFHLRKEYDSNMKEELDAIEQQYENRRMKEIHAYFLMVEQYGGAYETTVELLLEDLQKWMERVRLHQRDCKKYRRNVFLAVGLSILVCAITNHLLPKDIELSQLWVCQIASILFLSLDMLICFRAMKRTCCNWLKERESYGEGDEKKYRYVQFHKGVRSNFYRKYLRKKMEKEFPQWLMDISLLLQTENVQVAFYRIRPQTPEVLRPAVDDMLEELLDRFGEPGKAVLNLLAIAKLKAIAHQGYVTEIKQTGKTVRFTLYEKARLNTEGFPALMQKYRRGLQFKNEQEPKFILEPQGNLILALTEFAEELKSMAENM
mgnify:FL=1